MPCEKEAPRSGESRNPAGTIDKILKAAESEFAEAGYDNAKMERIAARAKISKQLVYHYFGSKTALYREVLKILADDNHRVLLDIDYENLSPVTAIRMYIEKFFDQYYNRPANAVVTIDQSLHSGIHVNWHRDTSAMYQRLIEKLKRVLSAGIEEGSFSKDLTVEDFEYMTIVIVSGSVMSRSMFQKMGSKRPALQGEHNYWKSYATAFILKALRP